MTQSSPSRRGTFIAGCLGIVLSACGDSGSPISETERPPPQPASPSVAERTAQAQPSEAQQPSGVEKVMPQVASGGMPASSPAEVSPAPLVAGGTGGALAVENTPVSTPTAAVSVPTPEADKPPNLQEHLASVSDAAQRFLDTLGDDSAKAAVNFDSKERTTLKHSAGPRAGLPIQEMSEAQVAALNEVLRLLLSESGFKQLWDVMKLEIDPNTTDDLLFHAAVFGEPGAEPWAFRLEGHHVSLNLTFASGGKVSMTPMWLGADPAVVADGERKGEEALQLESSLAVALVTALEGDVRAAALTSEKAPGDLSTGDVTSVEPLPPKGVLGSELSAEQRQQLRTLIMEYVGDLHPTIAGDKIAALDAAGYDAYRFAWSGATVAHQNQYYRIQGPTLLIEFMLKGGNHIHTVWREFEGDYGRDLL